MSVFENGKYNSSAESPGTYLRDGLLHEDCPTPYQSRNSQQFYRIPDHSKHAFDRCDSRAAALG